MSINGDLPEPFADQLIVAYLTVVARSVRQLDEVYGAGSVERFLDALQRSLEVETHLSRADEAVGEQLAALQRALVHLVEAMPPEEDL